MSRKPRTQLPPKGAPGSAGADFTARMALAGKIMREDRDVLGALADGQIITAREIMSRRKRALRDLAE